MTYSGSGRIAAARSNWRCGLGEVAAADGQPTQPRDRWRVVRHEREGAPRTRPPLRRRRRSRRGGCPGATSRTRCSPARVPASAAASRIASSAPAGRRAARGRRTGEPARAGPRDSAAIPSTSSLASSYRPSSTSASTTTPCAATVVREGRDCIPAGLEGMGELVAAELESAETDEHEDIVGRQLASVGQRRLRRGVQRGVRGLADALQEGEAEVALDAWIVGVGGGARAQRLDERLGRREGGDRTGRDGWTSRRGRARRTGPVCRRRGGDRRRHGGRRRRTARRGEQHGGEGQGQVGASARSWRGYGPRRAPDERAAAGRPARTCLQDATRVQDAERVEGGLDRAHHAHRVRTALRLEPLAARHADAVLAGDRAAEVERGPVEVGLDGLGDGLGAAGRRARRRGPDGGCRRRRARTSRSGRRASQRSPRSRGACPGPWSAAPRRPPSGPRRAARARSGRLAGPGAASRPPGRRRPARHRSRRRPGRRPRPVRARRRRRTPGMSDSTMSIAAAVRSRPRLFMSSTAAIVNRSRSSSVTGDSPAAAIALTASPAPSSVGEEREHRRARRRRRAQPERRLGDDRERALAADEQVGQRVAGDVLDVLAAGPDDGPVGHHDLERQRPSRASGRT